MNTRKHVMIIGDSYSTYGGYIPEGYDAYYRDDRVKPPVVHGVEKTWWHQLFRVMNYDLVMNDSYSGSTMCNTVRPSLTIDTSFVSRLDKYIETGFFSAHSIDTLFLFGGTNDSWTDAPVGELLYENPSPADLYCVLPAFCYLLDRIRATDSTIRIVVILNTDLKPEITDNFMVACEHYGVEYVQLADIDKENKHPTELGMKQMAAQIQAFLQAQ